MMTGFWSAGLSSGSAIPDSVVLLPELDDDTHFSGDTGSISINDNSPTFGGSQNNDLSFKITGENSVYSGSGLPNYPTTDTELLFRFYINSGVGCNVYYSASGVPFQIDGYMIQIRDGSNEFGFATRDSGNFSNNTKTFSYQSGQWYTVTALHQSNGDYTLKLFSDYQSSADVTVTGTDSTHITNNNFDHSGIAIREFQTETAVIDQYVADAQDV